MATAVDLSRCGAVIVAHTRLDLAHLCVASLRRWLPPAQIVVVLNVPGATTATLEGEARVLSPPAPQGYGANLNFGARQLPVDTAVYVLANDDLVFDGDALPSLVGALAEDTTVGVVGPRLVDPNGDDAVSFSAFPTVAGAIEAAAVLPRALWHARQRQVAREQDTGFLVGAALVVRRDAFDAVGGFDEDFFLNWEEADFCFRLRRAGWGVVHRPEATVTHLQGSSISRDLNFASYYASLRLYFRKRLGPVRWLLLELALTGVFSASVVYSAAGGLVRPSTARHRHAELRERWRARIFLRRSQPRRRSGHVD